MFLKFSSSVADDLLGMFPFLKEFIIFSVLKIFTHETLEHFCEQKSSMSSHPFEMSAAL
jgi:hypothetical protein